MPASSPLDPTRAERFAGSLLGQALGDALGFVVEGHGPAACRQHVEQVVRPRCAAGWSREPYACGQYSDDTQLARELATSLVARGGFDPADYAARVAALFAEGRVVGAGPSTEAAACRLAAGVPWHAAGTPGPVAGNGGAMRVAPLALHLAHDRAALARAAAEQARITHADPRCAAGAMAVAGAVAAALEGALSDADGLCSALAAEAQPLDAALAAGLQRLPRWLQQPHEAAAPQIALVGLAPAAAKEGRFGIAPHVTPSVLWALYAALRHPDDIVEAIAVAIAPGGDVDTTAAMAGAIVGAAVGEGALPAVFVERVHDRGRARHDELRALAHALAAL